ncbi:NUDIX hydrolase [Halomonas sp. GT]|uniref:NUDIX hydrolase n=1 Tax=Halomonas sp. GT TaxID=1971364 RepID=UPI0009F63274|nr:NUDIX domain-containing protein [Halomonas sp. GT]
MTPTKSCSVVLRNGEEMEVLAFLHPIAGLQLVKGTIEPGENPGETAVRELAEEAGILAAEIKSDLGLWESGYQDQIWSFHLSKVEQEIPDEWVHHTADDDGHDFKFFWYRLAKPTNSEWHEVFQGALAFIRTALTNHFSGSAKAGR